MAGYPDTLYAKQRCPGSEYPFQSGSIETETCIIGGGLAGIATSIALAEAGSPAVLIEANRIGWGASGRNGGFASRGYPVSAPHIADRYGKDTAKALWDLSSQALALVLRRAEAAGEAVLQGTGALRCRVAGHPDSLPDYVATMNDHFDAGLVHLSASQVRDMLDTDFYEDAYLNPSSLQINPLNLALSMAADAAAGGVLIFEHSQAVAIRRQGAGWLVETARGRIRARHVVLAGGAHLGWLWPRLGLATVPIASFVMSTECAPDRLKQAIRTDYAVSDVRVGTDYYRILPDGRLLWGGRASAVEWSAPRAKSQLQSDLARIYPQLADLAIEFTWSGLMPIARHRMPVIGPLDQGLWSAACFGGLGLVTTTLAGELIGAAIASGDDRYRYFAPFGTPFAGGVLGRAAFQAIYWRHKFEDRWRRPKKARAAA
jgi:gamma-glutamylputrescine oxidase